MNKNFLVCDICGDQSAYVRKINRTYGRGRNILVIENIPVVSCRHCGESYFEPETIRALERLKRNRKLAKTRSVAVASLE